MTQKCVETQIKDYFWEEEVNHLKVFNLQGRSGSRTNVRKRERSVSRLTEDLEDLGVEVSFPNNREIPNLD